MKGLSDSAEITMFVCANCARPGKELTSAGRSRPAIPDFNLPTPVQQIVVPCTGRLQPEHVLRAFESGSRIVSVVACREDNCHYSEGSRRCAIRVDYIRSILEEIGLGDGRLLLSYLPGSASEDLAWAAGKAAQSSSPDKLKDLMSDLRAQMLKAFHSHAPNPLQTFPGMPSGNSLKDALALSEDDDDE